MTAGLSPSLQPGRAGTKVISLVRALCGKKIANALNNFATFCKFYLTNPGK
jgi:hypothetical protein